MSYHELVDELLSCTTQSEQIDILLAYATEVYEVGYAAGAYENYARA